MCHGHNGHFTVFIIPFRGIQVVREHGADSETLCQQVLEVNIGDNGFERKALKEASDLASKSFMLLQAVLFEMVQSQVQLQSSAND